MKICAISPFAFTSPKEILQFIKNSEHDFIILPANASNHPTHKAIAKVLKDGVFVFVETETANGKLIPRLISSDQHIKMPSQVFTRSPAETDIKKLQTIWHKRTYKISNRDISFAMCGEIDAFKKDGAVKDEFSLPYDILVNPTHTIRGRWNHLGIKLKTLSIGKVVIYVANNNKNNSKLITDIRIYVDGVVMNKHTSGTIGWSVCEI